MNYSALALLCISSVYALEKSDLQNLVKLENAQSYEVEIVGFNDENNSIRNSFLMEPKSWKTTITLFFNEECSSSITYIGKLEGETLSNAIYELDRSIKGDIQKDNADNHIDLLSKQYKAISRCYAAIIMIGLPVLHVIYQNTFGSAL